VTKEQTGTRAKRKPDGVLSPEGGQLRLAYLISKYPAVSHTFILREILALRERGIVIEVASVNAPPPRNEMTRVEQVEADQTFYIKAAGAGGALGAMAWMLGRHPAGLLRSFGTALGLGRRNLSNLPLCLFYWVEAVLLARWMGRRELHHLHVHFASQAATVGMILTHMLPVTLSMTVHGPDEFYDVSLHFLEEKIARARFLVCISFFAQSQLMKLTPGAAWGRFDIARLGVDTEVFAASAQRDAPGIFQIVSVGRLVSTKGQRILIAAVEQLIGEGRTLRLQLIGDGPDRKELERLVVERGLQDSIVLTGSINQDRIRSFYESADLFALASFAEGIPVVLMEAMAMEIPCVATSINGIPELIRHDVDGLLVAPSDVEGMAAALARLMDDPELRNSLGKAGRVRVQECYELGKSADRLAAVFRGRFEE
jgi:colanic acid/amylovoran biosynthesis glycosyltransferase